MFPPSKIITLLNLLLIIPVFIAQIYTLQRYIYIYVYINIDVYIDVCIYVHK